MPPPGNVQSSLDFLNEAAHFLAAASPTTSAYLMSCQSELTFTNEIPQSDLQREHVCGCCGHIFVPGRGSSLKIEPKKTVDKNSRRIKQQQARPDGLPKQKGGVSKLFTCENCGRYTRITLPPAAPMSRRKIAKKPTTQQLAPTTQVTMPTQDEATQRSAGANANAGSKKRAKSRKAGLQALLAQSNTARSPGLSLADFMKK